MIPFHLTTIRDLLIHLSTHTILRTCLHALSLSKINSKYLFIMTFVFVFSSCGISNFKSKTSASTSTTVVETANSPTNQSPLLVDKIAAGESFTCAIEKQTDNNSTFRKTYCWGKNTSQQLGTDQAEANRKTPYLVPELETQSTFMALGSAFGCILSGLDTVKCWGKNDQFQIGNAQQTSGNNGLSITNVDDPNSDLVTYAGAGAFHSCFYTTSKTLQCIGNNWAGSIGSNSLGINVSTSVPINIPLSMPSNIQVQNLVSAHHTNYLLLSNGSVACWGNNGLGQCGLGNLTTPVGLSWMVMPPGILAKEMVGLFGAACILSQTNQMYCNGSNSSSWAGLLGDGTTTSKSSLTLASTLTGINVRSLPVQSGSSVTNCIITQSGGVKCWGYNFHGSVGNNNTTTPQMTPQDVIDGTLNPLTEVTSLVLSGIHDGNGSSVCALRSNGSVWCWGLGSNGQLGNNSMASSSVAVRAQLPSSAKKIFTGGIRGSCALLTDDSLHCWGANTNGKLGINSTANSLIPRQVLGLQNKVQNIISGVNHTCAHLVDGMLQCWGGNMNGVLGMSDLNFNRFTPSTPFPYYGGTSKVSAVSTGSAHTCILILGGYPKCFGNNQSGQLGIGTNISTSTPSYPRALQTFVTQLALGENHSCFLGRDGLVYCTGDNSFGQLGNGLNTSVNLPTPAFISDAVSLASGKNHVCAILSDKSTWCWGNNSFGQLATGKIAKAQFSPDKITGTTETFVKITAGRSHTCGLTTKKKVLCWGWNLLGQLGTGRYTDSLVPAPVVGLDGVSIEDLIAGDTHTCAATTDNKMYCWGSNESGQLGNSTLTKSATPILVELK